MKLLSNLLILAILFSCTSLDDEPSERLFEEKALSQEFLIGEKWYLSNVDILNLSLDLNGDGIESNNIKNELSSCIIDNSYEFLLENNMLNYQDNESICDDGTVDNSYSYQLDSNNSSLTLPFLIGFEDVNKLNEVVFQTSIENNYKIITGYFDYIESEKKYKTLYVLINYDENKEPSLN